MFACMTLFHTSLKANSLILFFSKNKLFPLPSIISFKNWVYGSALVSSKRINCPACMALCGQLAENKNEKGRKGTKNDRR